jgi:hypothetical protein
MTKLFLSLIAIVPQTLMAQANPAITYVTKGTVSVSNADGSNATKLSVNGSRPSFGPSGNGTTGNPYHIVFEPTLCALSTADVTIVNGVPKSSNVKSVPTPLATQACAPQWSPAGDKIVYGEAFTNQQPSSIWTISTDGTNETSLYDAASGNIAAWPTWNSDGSKIAFVEQGANPPYDTTIKVMDSNGQNVVEVLAEDTLYYIRYLDWARTKNTLVFQAEAANGATNIYTLDISTPGTQPQFVTTGNTPTWSPTDSFIAFVSGTSISSYEFATHRTKSLIKSATNPNWHR